MYFLLFGVLLILGLSYVVIAGGSGVVDNPKEWNFRDLFRIGGGGIIIYTGVLLFFVYSGFQHPYFFAGLSLIALLGFVNDMAGVRNVYRMGGYLLPAVLMLMELNLHAESWVLIGIT